MRILQIEESIRRQRTASLAEVDPEVYEAIQAETRRQEQNLELIASENLTSRAVREAVGSVMTDKYAEGYPGKRYYGGCEFHDVVESLARERAKQLFGAEHANVQPHAGAQANMAVYFAVLKPGDTLTTWLSLSTIWVRWGIGSCLCPGQNVGILPRMSQEVNSMRKITVCSVLFLLLNVAFGQFRTIWEIEPWPYYRDWIIAQHAQTDSQGDLVVSGVHSFDLSTRTDMFVGKFSSEGEFLWYQFYGSPEGENESVSSMAIDHQDNIITGGFSFVGATVFKYAPNGTILWQWRLVDTFERPEIDVVRVDSQDHVVLVGVVYVNDYQFLTAKCDPQGRLLWYRLLPRPVGGYIRNAWVDSQDNILGCAGVYATTPGGRDILLFKYSPGGELLYLTQYHAGYYEDPLQNLIDSEGNHYVIADDDRGVEEPGQQFLLKFDPQGNFLWRSVFGYTYYGFGLMNMAVSPDGQPYVALGNGGEDWFLTSFHPADGTQLWQQPVELPRAPFRYLELAWFDENGDLFATGYTRRGGSIRNVVTKFDPNGRQKWMFATDYLPLVSSFYAPAAADGRGHLYLTYNGWLRKLKLLAVQSEGDLDGDGCVTDADLSQLLRNFDRWDRDSDVNGDRRVNGEDLAILLRYFGYGCGD